MSERAPDILICNTHVRLGLVERFRVLIHGRVEVHTETPTADVVDIAGPTITRSWVPVLIPKRRRGYAEVSPAEQECRRARGPR